MVSIRQRNSPSVEVSRDECHIAFKVSPIPTDMNSISPAATPHTFYQMYLPSSMLSGHLCLIVSLNKCECIIGLMQYELAVHQQQQHKTDNVYMWQLLSLFNFTRDKQYGIYYPPRQLAVYIPTYFVLLFFCIPIMYMGLNMMYAPKLDNVDAIWDTMSNENVQVAESMKHVIESQSNGENVGVAIPSICDLDVREILIDQQ
eukprot:scaffold3609_cov65-Cyclotella_meneghiniana.AAC.12